MAGYFSVYYCDTPSYVSLIGGTDNDKYLVPAQTKPREEHYNGKEIPQGQQEDC